LTRKIGSLLLFLILVVILLLLARQVGHSTGVGNPTREVLSSPPDFVGWVLAVDPGSGQIRVENQADKIVRPVTVNLTEETAIFRKENGLLRQIKISDVHLQDQAELWLVGPVPSSFPAVVNVRQVVVENPY
jgi:hypothetical protein